MLKSKSSGEKKSIEKKEKQKLTPKEDLKKKDAKISSLLNQTCHCGGTDWKSVSNAENTIFWRVCRLCGQENFS